MKLWVLIGVLFMSALSVNSVAAQRVMGTYMILNLGQGISGGGSLLADGSVTGHLVGSYDNGQEIGMIKPTGWAPIDDSNILLCYDVTIIKSEIGQTDFSDCTTLPVAEMPVLTDLDSDGNPDLIIVARLRP